MTIRANKPVKENIIVHWSADCATEWAKYETLKGLFVCTKFLKSSFNMTAAGCTKKDGNVQK